MRKLYIFTNTKGNGHSGFEDCMSMADDGMVLGGHLCSSVMYMRGDLVDREDRMEKLVEYFGGKEGKAFEVIELNPDELPPEDILEKNKKLGEKSKSDKGSFPKIEITME